jgi:hypothetical protein
VTASKLPDRPTLESLRKQAKKLARDMLPAMPLPSAGCALNCRKPIYRYPNVMLSWCWRATMGFAAGRICSKK